MRNIYTPFALSALHKRGAGDHHFSCLAVAGEIFAALPAPNKPTINFPLAFLSKVVLLFHIVSTFFHDCEHPSQIRTLRNIPVSLVIESSLQMIVHSDALACVVSNHWYIRYIFYYRTTISICTDKT